MKKLLTRILLAVLLIFTVSMLDGCAAKRTTPTNDPTFKPITGWEQTNYTNVQIAIHARAAAKATVAARQTDVIDKQQFAVLKSGEGKILRAHQKLTPLLKDLPTALASKDEVKALTDVIADAVKGLVSTGTIGIKNPQSQASIQAEIAALANLSGSLNSILKSTGVLPQ